MQAISESGLVEFHWENLDGKNPNHEKRWVLDMFVPGSAEIMMINPEQADMFPETADFFERMAYLPLAGITEMVPPGGAGIGMHVIPVEKAIPAESKSLPIEHLSHWLKKYEGHIGVSVCSCRKQQRIRGEGSGDVEGEWCIGVGDFADYCRETNHGHDITYEEAMEILQKAEDRGYVHQITNIDGENKIFGICNCAVGVCNALRTSQLFNTPNLSASAYVAESDPEKCVACGKCVETCPAGAVRLGQKLCTKEGPIQYPHHELPDDTKWGEDHWNKNYRNENGCIQTWPTGTAPCKAACPAHIAIQGYIKMAGDGRYADALKLIKKDNPFPAVCGSICRKYCEDACTRGTVDEPLAIDEIKKFIAEQDMKAEHRYVPPMNSCTHEKLDQKIAIIGGGRPVCPAPTSWPLRATARSCSRRKPCLAVCSSTVSRASASARTWSSPRSMCCARWAWSSNAASKSARTSPSSSCAKRATRRSTSRSPAAGGEAQHRRRGSQRRQERSRLPA